MSDSNHAQFEVIWDGRVTGPNRGYLVVPADVPRTLTLEDNRHLAPPREDMPSLVARVEEQLRAGTLTSLQLERKLRAKQASIAQAISVLRKRGIIASQKRPGTDGQRRIYVTYYWIEDGPTGS